MDCDFESRHRSMEWTGLGSITANHIQHKSKTTPGCTYIGGLPYALPPTGQHRFRPPRPLPQGYSYGTKECPGVFTGGTSICPQPPGGDTDPTLWDEDCLQMNIWIPDGERPSGGWPVFFYIHGGFLQWGSANMKPCVVANLFHDTPFKAIVVMPAYRLNLFGFLASHEIAAEASESGETVGNAGFWDQRMALEWTKRNAGHLGGDADKITVAGYSAGSHSAFQQLAHDLDQPDANACINRVIMWSNGPGVQPKHLGEQQEQFDELIGRLGIGGKLTASHKLKELRRLPINKLVEVQSQMQISEFRALSDGAFVNKHLTESINDGSFAKKCKARGIRIMNGECAEEWNAYQLWRTPDDSYEDVRRRLRADYPGAAVDRLLSHCFPDQRLPSQFRDWKQAFGRVYADVQVYSPERGLADNLVKHGLEAGRHVLRYRIEWRAKCVDKYLPPSVGVTHATDLAIWMWGYGQGQGLEDDEKKILKPLTGLLADFVGSKDVRLPVDGVEQQLVLRSSGTTEVGDDTLWSKGVAMWEALTAEGGSRPRL